MYRSGGTTRKSIDGMTHGTDMSVVTLAAIKIMTGSLEIYDKSDNCKVGKDAAYFLTTGVNNIALGPGCCFRLTSGSENVCGGSQAGYNLGDACYCLLFGNDAGYNATNVQRLVALGDCAGRSVSGAGNDRNVFDGADSGRNAVQYLTRLLTRNTCAGDSSGKELRGADNTLLGCDADRDATSGEDPIDRCTGVGASVKISSGVTNSTAVGAGAVVLPGENNTIVLGDGSVSSVRLGNGTPLIRSDKGVRYAVSTVAADTTLDKDACMVLVTAACTITLPQITDTAHSGRLYHLLNKHSAAITVTATSGDTIDGSATISLPAGGKLSVLGSNATDRRWYSI